MLANLHERFLEDEPYTYVAHLLIAVNPLKRIPMPEMELYKGCKSPLSLSPHQYAIAEAAYTARCGHTGRVSVLVTDTTPREMLQELAAVLVATGNEVPRWLEGMSSVQWQGAGGERTSL